MSLSAYIAGIGVLGPGIADWPDAAAVLSGKKVYAPAATILPTPSILAAAERRRTGRVVKLALAIAREATWQANIDPSDLCSVFSSSGGDGQNCHELCQALAREVREVSPTRFSNSVHNASSGYWSIATGAMTESNVLCAFDASFTAGLLEALTQVAVDQKSVLLVAYDTEYPEPLHAVRPIPDAFGVALVLTPLRTPESLARVEAVLSDRTFDRLSDPAFETLRATIPAARSLPLLQALARRERGSAVLEYLDSSRLTVEVDPCS